MNELQIFNSPEFGQAETPVRPPWHVLPGGGRAGPL